MELSSQGPGLEAIVITHSGHGSPANRLITSCLPSPAPGTGCRAGESQGSPGESQGNIKTKKLRRLRMERIDGLFNERAGEREHNFLGNIL